MIIKCKMCGGDIQFNQGDTSGTCDYCGSTSTIPRVDDEQRLNRFNRANHFRRQGEFDKAIAAYDRILEEDDSNAEAHWGAALSRYGIEYVEDPATKRRIPTCHRVQVESILADADYQAALKYAPDTLSRNLYEEQAKEIAEIQKGILAISSQEKPYDVFICYKETDENGKRTRDSALAQEVYYGLTEQGYKVFFSRITLEDKLGQEYEPYIFAALNSAKVMLVVGTKPEHFNAVWVKNEWSRYLRLMKDDRKRLLIPCYRDMDPYDLPEELSNLQSQDISKIGFMQDLIRGIQKIIGEKNQNQHNIGDIISESGITIESLMKRVDLFIEDDDFDSAEEYLEKILDINPEYAPAYIKKVLVENKLHYEDKLASLLTEFEKSNNWHKAIRFADTELRHQLERYLFCAMKIREEKEKDQQIEITVQKRLHDTEDMFLTVSGMGIIINAFGDTFAFPLDPNNCDDHDIELLSELNHEKEVSSVVGEVSDSNRVGHLSCILLKGNDGTIKSIRPKSVHSGTPRYPAFPRANHWKGISEAIIAKELLIALTNNGELISSYIFEDDVYPFQISSGMSEKAKDQIIAKRKEYEKRNNKRHDEYLIQKGMETISTISIKQLTVSKKAVHLHRSGPWGFGILYEDGTIWETFNGTVVDSKEPAFKLWNDIKQIVQRRNGIVGLKKNGTVIATGNNDYGQCDTADWKNIKYIAGRGCITFGVTEEGKVKTAGKFHIYNIAQNRSIYDIDVKNECDNWSDIIHISCSSVHIVGLKRDGTVVAAGDNEYEQCNVDSWKNVVNVFAKDQYTVGILSDGRIVYTRNIVKDEGNNDNNSKSDAIRKQLDEIRLFDNIDLIEEEKEKRKEKEQARIVAERLEKQKREEEEKETQRKRYEEEQAEKARKALEEANKQKEVNKNKIEALKSEKNRLEIELANLKGLFTKKRRNEITTRLMEIDKTMNYLNSRL